MSKGTSQSGPSQRQLRVSETLRKTLADILTRGDIADPDLDGVTVTVAEVRISPDLKNATAYVLPLGGANQDAVLGALRRSRRYLRGVLARRVELKFMPDLAFEIDTRFEQSDRVEALLRSPKVARDVG